MPKKVQKKTVNVQALEEKPSLRNWFSKWRTEFLEQKYIILLSFIVLAIAGIVSFFASTYTSTITATASADLLLDHIPTVNLYFLYVYGFMSVLIIATLYTILFHIKRFHEIAFLFSMLILTRSFFITLTHLGAPSDAIIITGAPSLFQKMSFQNDLFFSGHTAMTFMAFLVFRKELIGKFFFVMTILMSTTVLLMHVHYTIDVFSAFFIAYGVYVFGEWFISKGYLQTKNVKKSN